MDLEIPIEIKDKNGKKKTIKEKRDVIFFENKIDDGSTRIAKESDKKTK